MPSPQKLMRYLGMALVVFVALSWLFPGREFEVVPLAALGGYVVVGLVSGELVFGRGSARRVIRRKESPAAFWAVAVFWGALLAGLLTVVFFGERRARKPRTAANADSIVFASAVSTVR